LLVGKKRTRSVINNFEKGTEQAGDDGDEDCKKTRERKLKLPFSSLLFSASFYFN
jgi:hypothetical protein